PDDRPAAGLAAELRRDRLGLRLALQPIRLQQSPRRRRAQGRRLGTCPARVAGRSAGSVHLHARTARGRRQPHQEPTGRAVRVLRNPAGLGDRGVTERSSRDALARNLVILVAGSGLLISVVGLSAIALLRRNAERTSQAALAVIAEQAASRIGAYLAHQREMLHAVGGVVTGIGDAERRL